MVLHILPLVLGFQIVSQGYKLTCPFFVCIHSSNICLKPLQEKSCVGRPKMWTPYGPSLQDEDKRL